MKVKASPSALLPISCVPGNDSGITNSTNSNESASKEIGVAKLAVR